MKKIRLALLRCDGHAYTFGPILAECDLNVYARNFHAEYYFMIDAYQPERLKRPPVPGFEVAKVWDKDPKLARGVADLFFGKPKVCGSVAEMTDGVDAAFINNQSLDGSDHLELAAPFLKRGIPVFVDKPFASTLKDALAMVSLAKKHKAPLFSASILSHINENKYFKRRFAELPNPVVRGVINGRVGAKTPLAGIIHGLSLAQAVFGCGVEWVESMGETPMAYLLLRYKDGREMLVANAPHYSCGDFFFCDVYTKSAGCPPEPGHLRSNPIGDPDFVIGAHNIVRLFKKMVLTRKPPVPYSTLLELIAVVEAGWRAHKLRKRVYLKELTHKP